MLVVATRSGEVASRTAGGTWQTHLGAIVSTVMVAHEKDKEVVWEGNTSVEEQRIEIRPPSLKSPGLQV